MGQIREWCEPQQAYINKESRCPDRKCSACPEYISWQALHTESEATRKDSGKCLEAPFQIAFDFIHGKLKNYPVFKSKFSEDQIPVGFLPTDRLKKRKELWKQILKKTDKKTVNICQSAISCFSKLLIPQALLLSGGLKWKHDFKIRKFKNNQLPAEKWELPTNSTSLEKYYKQEISRLTKIKFLVDATKSLGFHNRLKIKEWISAAEKKIKGYLCPGDKVNYFETIIQMWESFEKVLFSNLSERDLMSLPAPTIETLFNSVGDIWLNDKQFSADPHRQQNLILNSLTFSIFLALKNKKSIKRNEAADFTAQLLNEYCYRNPIFSSVVTKERTVKTVNDLFDNCTHTGKS